LCFEGPDEDLKLTENTQPAMLAVSVAALAVLRAKGLTADYVAGHSLGEYSALVAAGSLDFGDALRLVRKRGRYMQEAVPAGIGAMAALLKLPEGKLDSILTEAASSNGTVEVVSAANLNSPDQIVIAGHAGAVGRAAELAKSAGAKRALILPVSAPFHCALMEPAQERLKADLDATAFKDLSIPLVNNWRACEVYTGTEAREGLYHQVPNPVRWAETVRLLASRGVTRFIEVGAGGVLTGLLRNIDPALSAVKFGEAEDREKLAGLGATITA
jgi:[acyl-carrier-protein] S-malonyltransferase